MDRPQISKKDRMKIPRQEMPNQAPLERIKNFEEVALGFEHEVALNEADR